MIEPKPPSPDEHAPKSGSVWPFRLWLAAVILLTAALLVIGTAGAVRHALLGGSVFSENLKEAVLGVANFPRL